MPLKHQRRLGLFFTITTTDGDIKTIKRIDGTIQNNSAVTCDYQQCGILTSVDSDEPVQPPLKLNKSK